MYQRTNFKMMKRGAIGVAIVSIVFFGVTLAPFVRNPFFREALLDSGVGPGFLTSVSTLGVVFLVPFLVPVIVVLAIAVGVRSLGRSAREETTNASVEQTTGKSSVGSSGDCSAEMREMMQTNPNRASTNAGDETAAEEPAETPTEEPAETPTADQTDSIPPGQLPDRCPDIHCDAAWAATGLLGRGGGNYEAVGDGQVRCTECQMITDLD